jgi:hypothetical protein
MKTDKDDNEVQNWIEQHGPNNNNKRKSVEINNRYYAPNELKVDEGNWFSRFFKRLCG